MGALAYELRRGDRPATQPRLFAVPDGEPAPEPVAGAVVALPVVAVPPRPVPDPPVGPVVASAPRPTLDRPAGRATDGGATTRLAVAPVAPPVRTLDDLVGGLFGTLAAGRQTACVLCGGAVRPQPVIAGSAGIGRCDGCGTRYEE